MKSEIRKLLGTEKLIIGTERVIKALKQGDVSKVILANNTPVETHKNIERYQEIMKFEIQEAKETNEELGTLCKKPFSIAVIAIRP